MKGLLVSIIVMMLLSGCSMIAPKNLATQQAQLQTQHWALNGRVAVDTGNKGGNASIHWQQTGDDYALRIFGPLGLGAVQLYGKPHHVELITAKGKIYTARSPERLLQKVLGWQIPVSNLIYWIRALPAPQTHAQTQYDAAHRLTLLKQQGWTIHYLSYTNTSSDALPRLLALSRGNLKIRIVIDEWLHG